MLVSAFISIYLPHYLHLSPASYYLLPHVISRLMETLTFMHCCLASACKADGIPFEMDVQEMADQLTPDDVNAFAASLSGGEAKKSRIF